VTRKCCIAQAYLVKFHKQWERQFACLILRAWANTAATLNCRKIIEGRIREKARLYQLRRTLFAWLMLVQQQRFEVNRLRSCIQAKKVTLTAFDQILDELLDQINCLSTF
jgi:hypothetical protein